MDDPVLKASRVVPDGKPTPTFPEGRVCAVSDCITKLSRYNPADTCRVHTPPSKPRFRLRG